MTRMMKVVIDFDGTISKFDTLSLIGSTAAWARQYSEFPSALPPVPPTTPFAGLPNPSDMISWQKVVDLYLQDLKSLPLNPTIDAKRSIELASLSRVASSRILAGATWQHLRVAGSNVAVREGWNETATWLKERQEKGTVDVFIATLNWSKDLVGGCLEEYGFNVHEMTYIGNDLEFTEGKVETTGRVLGDVVLGEDKVRHLETVANIRPSHNGDIVVYIGDSVSDFPCLKWADYGLYIIPDSQPHPSTSFMKACKDAGIELLDISSSLPSSSKPCIYVAKSWTDIHDALRIIIAQK
ncbi:HAD-like domain-containing protein [Chytridium lagenaria]|nr:HAD-like domain-containing protein [Chytridium lagenaria]